MANANPVPKVYQSVVDDVIQNVREAFIDDGVDEQVLTELKQLWENKLIQSKVLEHSQQSHTKPQIVTINPQVVQAQPVPRTMQGATFQGQLPIISANSHGLIEMSGAAQAATLALPSNLYQQQLAALGQTITLTPSGQFIIQAAPSQLIQGGHAVTMATTTAAAHTPNTQTTSDPQVLQRVVQLDGPNDSSSDDDDDDDDADDKDDDDDEQNEEENEEHGEEEDPLNSGDDVSSEEDPAEVFDTENVVVCQFDKINRNKNKWKFHLKDGIMNLNGTDFVFQKSTGEAEW